MEKNTKDIMDIVFLEHECNQHVYIHGHLYYCQKDENIIENLANQLQLMSNIFVLGEVHSNTMSRKAYCSN